MHQLIRVIVPGTDQSDALTHATHALDSLVGIGLETTSVFDYYRTFEDQSARFKPYVANVINDDEEDIDDPALEPAFPVSSGAGQALLDDALESQTQKFVDVFDEFQSKLDDGLTPTDVMNDVDGVRFDLRQLGEYEGPTIYLYDQHGNGLWSPNRVSNYLDRIRDDSNPSDIVSDGGAVMAASGNGPNGRDETGASLQPWIVPADVHY